MQQLSEAFRRYQVGTKEVLRDRYQFRRTLHLANTPSVSARSCARPVLPGRSAPRHLEVLEERLIVR